MVCPRDHMGGSLLSLAEELKEEEVKEEEEEGEEGEPT